MLGIGRQHSHFVFAVIQSGVTCLIAAAIASFPSWATGQFFKYWLISWFVSWATMIPLVLLAAPVIRAAVLYLTREQGSR